jgi:hypothetical protein
MADDKAGASPGYGEVRERVERLSRAIVARARGVARQAGLDPSMPFLHAHNALVSLDHGRPWPEVDYELVRKVQSLERRSWEPYRILERWSRKRSAAVPGHEG